MKSQVYTVHELIPRFRELNAVYTTIVQRENIFYTEQALVTDFYKTFHDITFFERAIIEMMLATGDNKFKVLIRTLQSEIAKNIFYYEAHGDLFQSLDIYKACRSNALFYDDAIKSRLQITHEYGKELTELKNALDAAEWKGQEEAGNILQRKIKQVQPLYEEERKRLDALFQQQREAEKEAAQYAQNRFADIYIFDKAMLSILDSYHSKQDEPTKERDTNNKLSHKNNNGENTKNGVIYFTMKIIAAIYETCNNEQFANATETDYYQFFNLQSTEKPLQIKEGERTRVYYLLHKMYECLPESWKQNWRDTIFKQLEIDEKNYLSKYREPVSAIPSKKSKAFAQNMDHIFGKYSN